MAPCSNVITPKMIRRGQVQIGDKIELENQPVSMTEEIRSPQFLSPQRPRSPRKSPSRQCLPHRALSRQAHPHRKQHL